MVEVLCLNGLLFATIRPDGPVMAAAVQADRAYYLEKYSWDTVAARIINVLQRDGYLDANL